MHTYEFYNRAPDYPEGLKCRHLFRGNGGAWSFTLKTYDYSGHWPAKEAGNKPGGFAASRNSGDRVRVRDLWAGKVKARTVKATAVKKAKDKEVYGKLMQHQALPTFSCLSGLLVVHYLNANTASGRGITIAQPEDPLLPAGKPRP